MPAYAVFDVEVTDPTGFAEYVQAAGPIVTKYGGRLIAVGPPADVLEGSWQPKSVTVLEFPSIEDARRWYEAPEYQEPKALRQRCAITHAVLLDGAPAPAAS